MKQRRPWILVSIIVVVILVASLSVYLLLNRHNTPSIAKLYSVADGQGGVVALWSYKNGGTGGSRLSGNGELAWFQDNPANTTEKARILDMVSDGQGGVLFSWFDMEKIDTSNPYKSIPVFVQRLSAEGEPLWGSGIPAGSADGIALANTDLLSTPRIESDKGGGLYIVRPDNQGLYLEKVDPAGKQLWQKCITPESLPANGGVEITADGAGGLIIIARENTGNYRFNIAAQRYDSEGQPIWVDGGIKLYSDWHVIPPFQGDGNGNLFFNDIVIPQTFSANYSGKDSEKNFVAVQYLHGDGRLHWPSPGITIRKTNSMPGSPSLAIHDTSAATVFWTESPSGGPFTKDSLHAVRIDDNGEVIWQNDSVFSAGKGQIVSEIVACNSRDRTFLAWRTGKWRSWETGGEIQLQILDENGVTIRESAFDVFPSTLKYQSSPYIFEDGYGGVIIISIVGKNHSQGDMVYAQRLNASGQPLWGTNGIRLNP